MDDLSVFAGSVSPLNIACVGEAMIELSFAGPGIENPRIAFGGDSMNTAIYLKREIGDMGQVSFVTRLGRDVFSRKMLDFMEAEAIATGNIVLDENKLPGLYSIMTDERGERTFSYWRDNSAARGLFQEKDAIDFSVLDGFDLVYYSAITLAILPVSVREAFLDWLAGRRAEKKLLVAFDSNYRPALWPGPAQARHWTERAWRCCDIALPSADDEKALFGDTDFSGTIRRLHDYGVGLGALKRGESGPLPLGLAGELPVFEPAEKIVDTTAAGDSFNGAFLGALLLGADMVKALERGHARARATVGFAGALGG